MTTTRSPTRGPTVLPTALLVLLAIIGPTPATTVAGPAAVPPTGDLPASIGRPGGPRGPAGAQESDGAGLLQRYAMDASAPTVELPRALFEVSGLTVDDRGRLWGHNDEAARIYQLDPGSGAVLGSFDVGRWGWTLSGDWEGLAWADDRFFLVDSDGLLLEFRPGADGERVPYRRMATGLGRRCEIEGLGWDRHGRVLLLGCKTPREPALRGRLVLFAVSVDRRSVEPEPRVRVPTGELERFGLPDAFSVSAVDVHVPTGTIVVVAARQEAIAEISPRGALREARRLPRRVLPQAEGIAFGADDVLFLATEGDGGPARLMRLSPTGGGSP